MEATAHCTISDQEVARLEKHSTLHGCSNVRAAVVIIKDGKRLYRITRAWPIAARGRSRQSAHHIGDPARRGHRTTHTHRTTMCLDGEPTYIGILIGYTPGNASLEHLSGPL